MNARRARCVPAPGPHPPWCWGRGVWSLEFLQLSRASKTGKAGLQLLQSWLVSINLVKNPAFLFILSLYLLVLPGPYTSWILKSRARAKYFPLFQPFYTKGCPWTPSAPGASWSSPQKPQFSEFFSSEFGEFTSARTGPGELIHRLSPATLGRWSLEFVS